MKNQESDMPVGDWLRKVCEKKDAEGLEDWRGFYKRQLLDLDRQALKVSFMTSSQDSWAMTHYLDNPKQLSFDTR